MAIDDNTVYGLTGAQIKELPGKIEEVKGLAKELTANDYNYPIGNPTQIAAWLLPDGLYKTTTEKVYWSQATYDSNATFIKSTASNDEIYVFCFNNANHQAKIYKSSSSLASQYDLLSKSDVVDNLTTANPSFPLSANQGKVLKDLIDSITIRGAGAPTTSTVGQVGTLYEDTTNGDLYICTDATNPYVWEAVGGGPTVVQTTGTSTTDAMSQDATTKMVYGNGRIDIGTGSSWTGGTGTLRIGNTATVTANRGTAVGEFSTAAKEATAFGNGTKASLEGSLALGHDAQVASNAYYAIALGAYSNPTRRGQFDVSTGSQTTAGYNGSNYRLLTGLYDPQSAHDAATKGYVDPTTDSSAPTTATAGRLGEIRIDTTTNTAYMCVVSDSVTPAYEWKQITA